MQFSIYSHTVILETHVLRILLYRNAFFLQLPADRITQKIVMMKVQQDEGPLLYIWQKSFSKFQVEAGSY